MAHYVPERGGATYANGGAWGVRGGRTTGFDARRSTARAWRSMPKRVVPWLRGKGLA